jgi:hypothetical protein
LTGKITVGLTRIKRSHEKFAKHFYLMKRFGVSFYSLCLNKLFALRSKTMKNIGIIMTFVVIGCLSASCATTQKQSGLSQDKIVYQVPSAGTPEEAFKRAQVWVAGTLQSRENPLDSHEESTRYTDSESGVIVARHTLSHRRFWEQDSLTFTVTIDVQSGSLVFSNFTGEFGGPVSSKSLNKLRPNLDALANDYITAMG